MASSFIDAANAYVTWLESRNVHESEDIELLHGILGRLQYELTRLPHVESDDLPDLPNAGLSHAEVMARLNGFPVDSYAVVFDPLATEGEPPVTGSVHDDLADIYRDLHEGLAYARVGRMASAVWQWRLGYYAHWGRHLTHAQSVLWQTLADEG